MTSARRVHYSYQEYQRALLTSDLKLEYCDGEIYAMAGGTPTHAELCVAVTTLLRQALQGQCKVFSSDLMIRVEATDLSTYPDATVICGELQTAKLDENAATNPTLLVEVTSPSTEDYDRSEKFSHYKQLPSLQAVIFVSHKTPRLTVKVRVGTGWEEREYRSGDRLELRQPPVSLAVDDVYVGIVL